MDWDFHDRLGRAEDGTGAVANGGSYDPEAVKWTPLAPSGATSDRIEHVAVWTGTEMLVWGGADRFGRAINTGGIYSPASDSWRPMPTGNAPVPRNGPASVWTGAALIVFDGATSTAYFGDGGVFDLATLIWTPLATAAAPAVRIDARAVWTGQEMLVWGGTLEGFNRDRFVYGYTPHRFFHVFQRP